MRCSMLRSGRPPACCRSSTARIRRRWPRARRAGRWRSGRSCPISTPRRTSPSWAATRSGSWMGSSARCSRRTTRRARSGSSRAARRDARSARRRRCPRSAPARSRSWRSKPWVSARARSSSRWSTRGAASSSAVSSARTRRSRIHSRRRTLELELARSLSWWAAWCVANDDPDASVAAAAAKSEAAEAAVAACERAIQAHGGIGFTWEHVLHRLYKRALGIQSWEASSAQLRAEVASHLLDS